MAKKTGREETDNLSVLKQDLKQLQFGRLYFFYGEEHYLRDHYLQMLKNKLLDGPAEDFNYHRFTQENMNLQSLADAVEAMPMMAEFSLVQVDDYDLSKLNESDREVLASVLSDIPDYCVVVFVFDTVEYKVDGRQKKLAKVLARGLPVEFRRQNQRELNVWIRRHFKAHGKDIGDKQCEYLTFVTGGTMSVLGAEIEKIAAYTSGNVVTEQDIQAVVIPVLDAEVFDLTDAVAEGNYEKALQKLRTLLQMQEEPIPILVALGGAMRRLLYARISMASGKGEGMLAELLKLSTGRAPHSFVLQKTMTTARRVSDSFCTAAVRLCMEADEKLKSYSGDDQRTLELLLLQLAQEARRG